MLERHGLALDTDLGQHFLLDENLVDLALRWGEIGPDAVALEIGAGVGVLTRALAARALRVHAVEIDRRLEPALNETLAEHDNVALIWADAMGVDLTALEPAPTRMVANLPYDIATPIVLESLARCPGIERWCVMVQREVADRWSAPPGGRAYGAASVQLALGTRVTARRRVGREVFMPRPRVDSTLIAFERIGPPLQPGLRALIRAAFAHRRKTLVNTLGEAGAERATIARALERLGHDARVRPEQLSPVEFVRLFEGVGWSA